MKKNDRGEYRFIYSSILDDPDFREMDPLTFKVFFALKMSLGAAGIGVPRKLVLAEQVTCSLEQLERAFVELETPKPDHELGWIVRDRKVIWIVNGLKFEEGLCLFPNSPQHVTFIRNRVKPLGDGEVVQLFRQYYAHWFPTIESSGPQAGAERGPTGGHEAASDHQTHQTSNRILDTGYDDADAPAPAVENNGQSAEKISNLLITALNKGMQDNPRIGDRLNPIPHGHAPSYSAVLDIVAAGVAPEFARSFVYAKASTYKPDKRSRQIRSLSYLSGGLIQEWEKSQAAAEARGASRPAAHVKPLKSIRRNAGEENFERAHRALEGAPE